MKAKVSLLLKQQSGTNKTGVTYRLSSLSCSETGVSQAIASGLAVTNSYVVVDFEEDNDQYSSLEARKELLNLYHGSKDEPSPTPFKAGELGGQGGEYWKTEKNTAKRSDLIYWLPEADIAKARQEASTGQSKLHYMEMFRLRCRRIADDLLELQSAEQEDRTQFSFLRRPLRADNRCEDTVVGEMKIPQLDNDRMMLAVYPVVAADDSSSDGSRFSVHCDNPPGADGKGDNGRVLSFTYYLNPEWDSDECGGNLRIYDCGWTREVQPSPAALEDWCSREGDSSTTTGISFSPNASGVDVAPLLNRLVIFFSDERVPHEVLPVKATSALLPGANSVGPAYRCSLVLWYSYLSPQAQLLGMKAAFADWTRQIRAKKKAEEHEKDSENKPEV